VGGHQEDTVASNSKRDLYRGLDDGWTRAMELALTPVLFGFIGYLIDSWVGTRPAFTIVLVVIAVAGVLVKVFYAYERAMRDHDASSPWGRPR
jgi:F0F1-type ATP synthase assembly protein I